VGDIQQQIADGAGPRLARVGDVIEHGQDIPANVVAMTDKDRFGSRLWRRTSGGFDYYDTASEEVVLEEQATLAKHLYPLTVVEVDPEPQPAERRLIGPAHAHLDAPCTDACYEPAGARDEKGTATGDNQLDVPQSAEDLRALLLPIWQEHASSSDEPDNAQLVRWVTAQIETVRYLSTRLKAAESGPITLSLPQVPDGAVALVGSQTGWRYVLWGDGTAGLWHSNDPDGGTEPGSLGALLHAEGGEVTVEFAPPREPRTWKQLTPAPDDLEAVEVGDVGILRRHPEHRDGWVSKDNALYFWREVLELGEVREVLT
jgi:hypothetical protein